MNYTTATPIQEQAIPLILQGRDLVGTAQTGTGKTAAFVLPLLNLILESGESHYTQGLIIVPTRELALQIEKVISAYAYFAGVSCLAVYGGGDAKSFGQEKTAITSGADIIVATPGRLIAHFNLGYVDFSKLRFLVLDEADRMLDMGFKPDLLKIIGKLNTDRQTLLFSATMPPEVMRFAKTFLRNPATVSIALSKPAEGVSQGAYLVDERLKPALIVDLLKDRTGQKIIVFGSSKQSVHTLYHALRAKGLPVAEISSDLEQEQREQVMLEFRNGRIETLVATDVLSRGIDVDNIDLVVNYDVPRAAEDYVHRIGRTGRAGASGLAVSFVGGNNDARLVGDIEKLIKTKIELEAVEFDEDQPDIRKQGRINDGRRMYQEGSGESGGRGDSSRSRGPRDDARSSRPRSDYARPTAPRDPFFDKPYEAPPAVQAAAPAWEASARPAARGISSNIKHKVKVAALFKAP